MIIAKTFGRNNKLPKSERKHGQPLEKVGKEYNSLGKKAMEMVVLSSFQPHSEWKFEYVHRESYKIFGNPSPSFLITHSPSLCKHQMGVGIGPPPSQHHFGFEFFFFLSIISIKTTFFYHHSSPFFLLLCDIE